MVAVKTGGGREGLVPTLSDALTVQSDAQGPLEGDRCGEVTDGPPESENLHKRFTLTESN